MKLPNMALVFAIIMIPILLIFSLYVGYQVDTVSKQSVYDTRLISATSDAIKALEMNTFGDSTKDSATSTRRNIKASINTFTNSYSANFGITGYDSSDVLTYVPALLFTMYDGYYIYSQNSENKVDGVNQYVLKPYIYYSARYKGTNYDVVINYSLDNYVTITGEATVSGKKEYISMSGYLIDISGNKYSETKNAKGEITKIVYDGVEIGTEVLYETAYYYEEDYNLDGAINDSDFKLAPTPYAKDKVNDIIKGKKDVNPTRKTIKCRYCYKNNQKYYYFSDKNMWLTYNPTGHLIKVNPTSLGLNAQMLNDASAMKYYKEAHDFTEKVNSIFTNGVKAKDMIEPNKSEKVSSMTDTKNVYYIFRDDTTNVLDPTGDNKSAFNQHKLNVMQASITYNLNVAISNYSNNSGGQFLMPEMSENEWNKILTNISMVSFVQGMPIGFKKYNNYAIVTSTNNEMYVSDESIYYVNRPRIKPFYEHESNNKTSTTYHHRAECKTLHNETAGTDQIITGYASTEFDKYTVDYQTEYQKSSSSKAEKADHYLSCYRHLSLDCYDCIVTKINTDKTTISATIKQAQMQARARIKYNQYKVTKYINDKVDNS